MYIYLDNAATTAISAAALEEYNRVSLDLFANPSSLHSGGLAAKAYLEECRRDIASILGVKPANIYFTSGGTLGDNLAVFSACNRVRDPASARVITTSVEHHGAINCFKELEKRGFDVVYLPVSADGIDMQALEDALTENTVLVNMMHVNNETGHIFPIIEASRLVHTKCPSALFHVDGVQSFAKEDIKLTGTYVDSFAASAHKFHGPRGVGFVYLSNRFKLQPYILGGGQEKNIISGTENLPGIGAMTAAAKEACLHLDEYRNHVIGLRDMLWQGLSGIEGAERVSPENGSPYILNVSFRIPAEIMLNALNARGICVSAGSACASNSKTSHVLTAMGYSQQILSGAIRFSFSHTNTQEDIRCTLDAVNDIISTVFTRPNRGRR